MIERYYHDYPSELLRGPRTKKSKKVRWRFKPRSFWPVVFWGFSIFLGVKLLLLPLTEGVYNYINKTQQVKALEAEYNAIKEKLIAMKKLRDYMKTPAYIEEKGHQIGLIKSNEAPMLVVDSPDGVLPEKEPRKNIEIGD